ncbi:MAG: hypothetical protein FD189_1625 [Elusimicrobia bacterium]|nr:MAG: hypothetical protein FD154_1834 [Elusimicrobiota bacterium]KAF0154959.1 MAG: hypothetical protein FD189_1625 [Elusimicrobiota bacterium]
METTEELTEKLRRMGCKKPFKPYRETGTGALLLHVRRPAAIVEGRLVGSEIDLHGPATFRVWTSQKKKAASTAREHGLKVRLLDGEAELFIPAALADELLPKFGAKVKRELSEAERERLKARLLRIKPHRKGLSACQDRPLGTKTP